MVAITEHEQGQISAANASGKTPVVFVHGLWLLPSSWDRWRTVFEEAGYSTLAPGWPDDPETVAEANRNPKVFAGKSIKDVADHFDDVIRQLTTKPAIVGHSFGGLLTQILAGRGLSAASVAIDPAPFRGVLPLPISALRSSAPVLTNPLNHNRAVPLTHEQFRYAFANAVSEDEARRAVRHVRGARAGRATVPGGDRQPQSVDRGEGRLEEPRPRAVAHPRRRARPHRPWAIANASYNRQKRNAGVTEIAKVAGRAMPSRSTAAGATSPTCRSPSSGGSSSPDRRGPDAGATPKSSRGLGRAATIGR